MSFLPRSTFPFPTRAPSYFLGHMARSLRDLPALLGDIDLVIEARDARLPLSGVNPNLERVINRAWGPRGAGMGGVRGSVVVGGKGGRVEGGGGAGEGGGGRGEGAGGVNGIGEVRGGKQAKGRERERIVVYTKRDLAEARYEEPLRRAFWRHAGQRVFFANTAVDKDVKRIMAHAAELARRNSEVRTEMKVLVVGMPNVGKSSLLNALRRVGVHKGKAFRVSSQPGHTRKLTGTVRIHSEPDIYVYDTPGVMMPYLGEGPRGGERGLKLALTAGIKEGLFEEELVAEYLHFVLNKHRFPLSPLGETADPSGRAEKSYLLHVGLPDEPTNSLPDFLEQLARRLGTLRKGGETDIDAAMTFFLRSFREGKLGALTLDDLISPAWDPSERSTTVQDEEDRISPHTEELLGDENWADGQAHLWIGHDLPAEADQKADLDEQVSATVKAYLDRQERANEAIEESQTQRKKKEIQRRKLDNERKLSAKRESMGLPGPGTARRSTSVRNFARNWGRARSRG